MTITLDEQLEEVKREIGLRRRLYPRWVTDGKMSQAKADRGIAAMEAVRETLERLLDESERLRAARTISEYHEDIGPVLWWLFPIDEPPYCGTPTDRDWPGYHTHWTPIQIPTEPKENERA